MDRTTSKRKRDPSLGPSPKRVSLGEITNAQWDCVVARRLDAPKSPTSDDTKRMKAAVFKPTELFLSKKTKELGNNDGMRILKELRDLREKVQELQERYQGIQQDRREDKLQLRVAALNEWSNQRPADRALSHNRIILAHGGDVLSDVWVIESYAEDSCAVAWKRAFKVQYGVPFEELQARIHNAPDKLITTLNHRANARHLDGWKTARNEDRRSNVGSIANQIIMMWDSGVSDLFMDGSESLRLYNEMEHEYMAGLRDM